MPAPRITTKTIKRYAQPVQKPWRDTIAVIGRFSKGPTDAISFTPETFADIYGLDKSDGSVNVQQAISLGATNFVGIRAIPEDSGSTKTLTFSSGNPDNIEPVVGYTVDSNEYNYSINDDAYTIGLNLSLNYVGSAFVNRSIYEKVETVSSVIKHPAFDGKDERGIFKFVITDFKAGATIREIKYSDHSKVLSVKTAVGSANTYQVVEISTVDATGNDYSYIDNSIIPGYVFGVVTAGSGGAPDTYTKQMQIVTKPFVTASNKVGVIVKLINAVTTAGSIANIAVIDPASDVYVIGYKASLQNSGSLTATTGNDYFSIPNEVYNNGLYSQSIDAYFLFDPDCTSVNADYVFKYFTRATSSSGNTNYILSSEGLNTVDATKGIVLRFNEGVLKRLGLLKTGEFIVPLASASITSGSTSYSSDQAYKVGTPIKTVLRDLQQKAYQSITFNELVEELEATLDFFPYTLTMNSALKGKDANRLNYILTKYVKGGDVSLAQDLYIGVGSAVADLVPNTSYDALSGAFTGPTYASADFYTIDGTPSVRIQAVSPGLSNIKVSVAPLTSSDKDSTRFSVYVEAQTEVGTQVEDVLTLDTRSINPTNGLFTQSVSNGLVRVYFIPYLETPSGTVLPAELFSKFPARSYPAFGLYSTNYNTNNFATSNTGTKYMSNILLKGGLDFNYSDTAPLSKIQIDKEAYAAAVKKLKDVDAAIVIVTGITFGDSNFSAIFADLVDQTKKAGPEIGLRQLLVEGQRNLPAKQAAAYSSNIDSGLVSIVNGHISQQTSDRSLATGIGVLGYYAGLAVTRPPNIAPHAMYNGQFLPNIQDSDTKNNQEYKDIISDGRVESLYYDNGLRGWKFLNGLTTAIDPTDRYFSVVRTRLQINSDFYKYLQWVRSRPNTPELQREVTTSLSAYMNQKLSDGWILSLGAIVCGPENNTAADAAQGVLNIQLEYGPVVPTDFINLTSIENYTQSLSLAIPAQPGA